MGRNGSRASRISGSSSWKREIRIQADSWIVSSFSERDRRVCSSYGSVMSDYAAVRLLSSRLAQPKYASRMEGLSADDSMMFL